MIFGLLLNFATNLAFSVSEKEVNYVFFSCSFQITVEMFDYLECELNLFLGGKFVTGRVF